MEQYYSKLKKTRPVFRFEDLKIDITLTNNGQMWFRVLDLSWAMLEKVQLPSIHMKTYEELIGGLSLRWYLPNIRPNEKFVNEHGIISSLKNDHPLVKWMCQKVRPAMIKEYARDVQRDTIKKTIDSKMGFVYLLTNKQYKSVFKIEWCRKIGDVKWTKDFQVHVLYGVLDVATTVETLHIIFRDRVVVDDLFLLHAYDLETVKKLCSRNYYK